MPPVGGLFSVSNTPVRDIIAFAYKFTDAQTHTIIAGLPSWIDSDRFDIEARAEGTPTKDQFRLMVQSLLAERFKLKMHRETRRLQVYALLLAKAGKTGPQLVPHSEDPPCSNVATGAAQVTAKSFLNPCGLLSVISTPQGFQFGTRNVTMQYLADNLPDIPGVDLRRPLLDRTGLAGAYDITLLFIPELRPGFDLPPDVQVPSDTTGPTFLEALRAQAGLRLVPQKALVDVLVIDHIEEPAPN